MKKFLFLFVGVLFIGAGCTTTTTINPPVAPTGTPSADVSENLELEDSPQNEEPQVAEPETKTIQIGGVVEVDIPADCLADSRAGTQYVVCPTEDNPTPTPEFLFSSDGMQVAIRRHEGLGSPYWADMIASLRLVTPLNRAVEIIIEGTSSEQVQQAFVQMQQPVNSENMVSLQGGVQVTLPEECGAGAAAGTRYVTCPTENNATPPPEFTLSSDGKNISMNRWEGLESPYWDDVLASLKIEQLVNRTITISIEE